MEISASCNPPSWKARVLAKANVETNVDNNVDAFQSLLVRDLKSDISKAERRLAAGEETYNTKVIEFDEEISELKEQRNEILTTVDLTKITTIEARKGYKGAFLAAIEAIDIKIAAKVAEKAAMESSYNSEVSAVKTVIAKKQALIELFQ